MESRKVLHGALKKKTVNTGITLLLLPVKSTLTRSTGSSYALVGCTHALPSPAIGNVSGAVHYQAH